MKTSFGFMQKHFSLLMHMHETKVACGYLHILDKV